MKTAVLAEIILLDRLPSNQKNPRVRQIFVCNSGAEMGYGRLEKCVLSAGKTHVHKIPRFRRGEYFGFLGGECRYYFYGREDFLPSKHGFLILCAPHLCSYWYWQKPAFCTPAHFNALASWALLAENNM